MGEVWRARDPRLGRDVAIKILPASFSQDADRLRRFEQEARAAGVLNHPNVTVVYDIGSHDGAPYVIQELLEGETLRSELAGGRIPPRRAIDYAVQIARGLAAAHEKGIVHRDLKPDNVFVTKDGRVKILDFGLAKLIEPASGSQITSIPTETRGTEPGVVLGTLGYMSPEQVRGQAADARTDIFAFGAILYEMLSGRRAFRGDSAADTMSAILREDPPDLALTNQNVSPALERIVRHCLEKEPERRFHSAHDLAFDLEAASAASDTKLAATRTSAYRSSARSAWLLAAVALIVLPLAGYLLGKRRTPSAAAPSYRQLTFGHGSISAARFAPDGQTIAFSASWDGDPFQLYTARLEFPEARPLGYTNAALLSISSLGEIALIPGGAREPHLMVTGTVARVPLSGGAPREIVENVRQGDWAPGDKGLAVARSVAGKDRLELPVGKVVYETSGWIGWPRVSPAGDRIAFFDHEIWVDDRGSVAVVDLSGNKRTLSTGWESEEGLAWSPDGREVWFTAARVGLARDLYAVDLDGRQRLVARVPGGVILQDIFRDGRALLTRDTERLSISCLAPGEDKERDLSWLEWSLPTDLTPDGKTLLFCEQGVGGGPNYAACMRKTDGSPVLRLGDGFVSEFSPDGKWVASLIQSPNHRELLPTGAGDVRKLERGSIQSYTGGASFFPDGKRLLFCVNEANGSSLYVQEIPAGSPRRVADGFFTFSHPISPDGKTLVVFDRDRKIVLLPADGGAARPLPGVVDGDYPIRWSQDGAGFFVSHGDFPVDLVRIDVSSGRRTLIRRITPADPAGVTQLRSFVLTPDARTYAYGCSRVLSDLYLAEGLR
jgi:Tol biopolymer transport system component